METTAISFLVVYNIMLFQIKGFKDYIDMYVKHCVDDNGQPLKVVYEQVMIVGRWLWLSVIKDSNKSASQTVSPQPRYKSTLPKFY